VLGHAYAPRGRPVSALTVALTVGQVHRELLVLGDRSWAPNHKTASPPTPFTRMPLTYGRAFGGTVPINLDQESVFDLSDTCNKHGLGFDAERMARELAVCSKLRAGIPRFLPGMCAASPTWKIRVHQLSVGRMCRCLCAGPRFPSTCPCGLSVRHARTPNRLPYRHWPKSGESCRQSPTIAPTPIGSFPCQHWRPQFGLENLLATVRYWNIPTGSWRCG